MAGIVLPVKGGATALENLDVTNMFVGQVVVDDAARAWQLQVSQAALDSAHKAVLGSTALRWVSYLTGGQDPWFAQAWARIQSYDPTLTDVVVSDECGAVTINWDNGSGAGGSVTNVAASAFDIQTSAANGGIGLISLKGTANAKVVPNLRTSHYAMAVRVTKIVNIATSNLQMATFSDGVGTATPIFGIIGATSQTNYAIKLGSGATTDTGVAQSAVGTYDTLIMLSDGTNLKIDINFAAPPSAASQAIGTNLAATAAYPALAALNAAAANTGFRVDKILVVLPPAS